MTNEEPNSSDVGISINNDKKVKDQQPTTTINEEPNSSNVANRTDNDKTYNKQTTSREIDIGRGIRIQ